MKKLISLFVVLAAAVMFSACSAFGGSETRTDAEDEPYAPVVAVKFDTMPIDVEELQKDINKLLYVGDVTVEFDGAEYTVEVVSAKAIWADETAVDTGDAEILGKLTEGDGVLAVELGLKNVPPMRTTIDTSPMYKVRTTVMFNPISVMPEIDGVSYSIGLGIERRSTTTTADLVDRADNGVYGYYWFEGVDMIFVDTFANTPTYFFIAIGITGLVAAVVYFTCKRRTTNI